MGDGALGGCGRRYGCSAEQGSDGGLDAEGDGRFYVDIWAGLFRGCGLGVLGLGVGFEDLNQRRLSRISVTASQDE